MAITRNSVALAANGFTARVIATWNPQLPRSPRVLVPVQLDALVIRSASDAKWANCRLSRPPGGSNDKNRRDLLPAPFTYLDSSRPPGIYLHWALPDALTHGTGAGSSGTFPAIPDRWLVLRISQGASSRRAVQGWVLKAGDSGGDPTPANPYPTPLPIDLDSWSETTIPPVPDNPLTAFGHGDPAWAAYYDNTAGRLGYYDDMKGVTGPVAYCVCGWYSNPAMDPLGGQVQSLTDFDARMKSLAWELAQGEFDESQSTTRSYSKNATMLGLDNREAAASGTYAFLNANFAQNAAQKPNVYQPGMPAPGAVAGSSGIAIDGGGPIQGADGAYTSDGSWWPQLSLYHGSVIGIGWPTIGWPGNENGLLSGEAGGPPAAAAVKVAVAETIPEGLATLAASIDGSPDEARVLEAFALGALPELDLPDGRARVDARLHASAFLGRDGGSKTESVWQPAMPPGTPPLAQNVSPDSSGIFPPSSSASGATTGSPFRKTGVSTPRGQTVVEVNFTPQKAREESVFAGGGLIDVVGVTGRSTPPPQVPGHFANVNRSLPRLFQPADPVLLVQGGRLSYKHGGDGRFSPDGSLICRLSGFEVTELSCNALTGQPNRPSIAADDVLERGIENGSVPPDCEDLLRETVLLDPGSAASAASVAVSNLAIPAGEQAIAQQTVSQRFMVEQTAWMAVRDPRTDHSPLLTRSGLAGALPSPLAVNLPARPWTPLHLDWQVSFYNSKPPMQGWFLDEVDYLASSAALPAAEDAGTRLSGRVLLTGGAARALAQTVRNALTQAASAGGATSLPPNMNIRHYSEYASNLAAKYAAVAVDAQSTAAAAQQSAGGVPSIDRSPLADIAGTLESMDVLVGALDGFHTMLRGGLEGDGKTTQPSGSAGPTPFVPFRAGVMKIERLRLVDCFGQFVDLAGSSDTSFVDPAQLIEGESMRIDAQPGAISLPPRFTSPARLWLRFSDAAGSGQDATPDITPVCGYLMPNHLDGALEFFDVQGGNLGFVRPDDVSGAIVWEIAPGVPSTVGQNPGQIIQNSYLASIAQALLDWGAADASGGEGETALSALLRTLDSTLWSVDPFAHTGDEHVSLLVGHPVAVMRARVRLEVQEPVTPDLINQLAVSLRLGALAHWQDGLLGYFINDDHTRLYCADGAVAQFAREVGPGRGFLQQINLVPAFFTQFSEDLQNNGNGGSPVAHPYVNTDGKVAIQPNQDFNLTLLLEPHAVVHATSGLQPRKEVGMRREWVQAALARLSPTFRFGPVLVDPKRIRMPLAKEIKGTWSWDHRQDVTTWADDTVTNSTADPVLPPDPSVGTEGWLRLTPPPTTGTGSGS